jgi:hypothetical protein
MDKRIGGEFRVLRVTGSRTFFRACLAGTILGCRILELHETCLSRTQPFVEGFEHVSTAGARQGTCQNGMVFGEPALN